VLQVLDVLQCGVAVNVVLQRVAVHGVAGI